MADTYVAMSEPARNFGSLDRMLVNDNGRRAHLKFDISGFGSSSSASLSLVARGANATTRNMTVGVYPMTNTTWGEMQVTWNTKPSAGATPVATFVVLDNVDRTYTVDLSSYVQARRSTGATRISLELRMPTSTGTYVIVSSREASANQPGLLTVP
jgi:hypothetical protein